VVRNNLICLVVDRLHAGMIGAYGNNWINTAALDHLASESFLFDQAFVDSPQLERLYRACWLGIHAAGAQQPSDVGASLPQLLAKAGVHTALVTDEVEVAGMPLAADFAEQVLVESPRDDQPAEDVSETGLARLFGAATEWLHAPRQPFCLWVHARGMAGSWDAPFAMRKHFADQQDPVPPAFTAVPDRRLPDEFDLDELLGIKHAYAGQVAALDLCVGAFCEQFEASGLAANTLLTFLSARGFPLGEHLRVGACDEALYNETAQLVWLMRFPDSTGSLARTQALVQPADLPGTLLECLDLDRRNLAGGHASSLLGVIDGRLESLRDRVFMLSCHDRAIRTPAWHLRLPDAGAAELYAKPSDRWEVNEVAKLLHDIVVGLKAALAEIERTGCADPLAPLAEPLVSEVD
jgi:arylsulfatase A-like enzyme